jgi:hypothetical protein
LGSTDRMNFTICGSSSTTNTVRGVAFMTKIFAHKRSIADG